MEKRTTLLAGLMLFSLIAAAFGQTDRKAADLLDKAYDAYRQAESVRITFTGSQEGSLLLQGDCFRLECGGVKSWFDGKTQWSYVEENGEVTVSEPSAEELQGINPYFLVTRYRENCRSRYAGTRVRNGRKGEEIVLTPLQAGEIASVTLTLSANRPVYMGIRLSNGEQTDFNITSYRQERRQPLSAFRFDSRKYPDAEIIDMR